MKLNNRNMTNLNLMVITLCNRPSSGFAVSDTNWEEN